MNAKRLTMIVGVVFLGAILFLAGAVFAQADGNDRDRRHEDGFGWGVGHMFGWDEDEQPHDWGRSGMMNGYGSMMGAGGMMDGYGGMMGAGSMMGPAMMGGWGGLADVEPLSIEDAEHAVAEFVAELDEADLAVGEIMIFENHAYAQVIDADSGQGAFEVLVDPLSGNVYPEPGPNMIWNTTYGHMANGRMGMMGMMGGYGFSGRIEEGEAALNATAVVERAQAYLDEYLPEATADDHADAFPGYYTLHVLRDGQIVGMLSVNAYTGAVFPHTWHGDFVNMVDPHTD